MLVYDYQTIKIILDFSRPTISISKTLQTLIFSPDDTTRMCKHFKSHKLFMIVKNKTKMLLTIYCV